MPDNKPEPSGVVGTASKHVGICVGKAAAVGRTIAALGSRGTAAVGSLLTRPLRSPALVTEEDIELTSQAYVSEARRELEEAGLRRKKRSLSLHRNSGRCKQRNNP